MTVKVLSPGPLTTIQDLGRYGSQKYGVIVSGAMDSYSLRIANILVGNEESEGAMEITLFGTSLQFEKDTLIAITGGDLLATIDGENAPLWRPLLVKKGEVLKFKSAVKGARAYVSFAGGIAIPKVMGSKSTYLSAGIGGFHGRVLQKNDSFQCGVMNEMSQSIIHKIKAKNGYLTWSVNYNLLINLHQSQVIRVLKGTEFSRFDSRSQKTLFADPYILTTQADRMGSRLKGSPLLLDKEFELLSEGVTFGTIQVPSNGQPIILMADRQTTGGYPKIGQVISVDLSSLAQLQPGAAIHFVESSLEEAVNELFKKEQIVNEIKKAIHFKAMY